MTYLNNPLIKLGFLTIDFIVATFYKKINNSIFLKIRQITFVKLKTI